MSQSINYLWGFCFTNLTSQRISADRCTYNAELHGIKSQWRCAVDLARTPLCINVFVLEQDDMYTVYMFILTAVLAFLRLWRRFPTCRTLTPDIVAFNTVISACGQAARWDRTLALLENMVPGQNPFRFPTGRELLWLTLKPSCKDVIQGCRVNEMNDQKLRKDPDPSDPEYDLWMDADHKPNSGSQGFETIKGNFTSIKTSIMTTMLYKLQDWSLSLILSLSLIVILLSSCHFEIITLTIKIYQDGWLFGMMFGTIDTTDNRNMWSRCSL